MTLEEILEAVSQLDNADDIKEAIVGAVESEKERGINATRKKDKDVLKLKATLKELGYDKEEYDDLSSFVESTKKSKEESQKSKLTISSLNDKVEDLITSLTTEREARQKVETRAKNKTLDAELTRAIGEKLYGSKYLIRDLISSGSVDVNENGDVFFKKGDEIITFEKGIEGVLEDNKDMLRVNQVKGTGDSGGNTPVDKNLLEGSPDEILDRLNL